jgi:hypothetical protein
MFRWTVNLARHRGGGQGKYHTVKRSPAPPTFHGGCAPKGRVVSVGAQEGPRQALWTWRHYKGSINETCIGWSSGATDRLWR